MTKLRWMPDFRSGYLPLANEVWVGGEFPGREHMILAHEMAHRRTGLNPLLIDGADAIFRKELRVWQAALEREPDMDEGDRALVVDSLGGYLGDVADMFGYDSETYRRCLKEYDRFMREWL